MIDASQKRIIAAIIIFIIILQSENISQLVFKRS